MPSRLHTRLTHVVDSDIFERAIIGLIILNAVTLGLETSERAMAMAGPLLISLDRLSDAHAEREAMMSETGNVLSEVKALRAQFDQLRNELLGS